MTRQQAKEITMKCRSMHRYVDVHGVPYDPCLTFDPVTGITTRDISHLVAQDFEMFEFHIVSTPVTAKVTKLRPNAKIKQWFPDP